MQPHRLTGAHLALQLKRRPDCCGLVHVCELPHVLARQGRHSYSVQKESSRAHAVCAWPIGQYRLGGVSYGTAGELQIS